jgi:antitoxin ParD1/3/4/toxin ParE1/3/4
MLEIWQRIAGDSVDLADRIENELHDLFATLARMPAMGHKRQDLRHRDLRFFPLYSFMVAYQPDEVPLVIVGVLRGKRNFKKALKGRLLR